MKKTLLATLTVAGSVFFAIAQANNFRFNTSSNTGIFGLLNLVQTILASLVPILVALATLAFFWFIVLYIWKGRENPDEYAKSKQGMFYSILALFVMVSIWGIINFFGNMLGIGQGGSMGGFNPPGT